MKKRYIILSLMIALFLALFLTPFASKLPDGLEKVAENKGFIEHGEGEKVIASPMADYIFPNIKNEKFAASIAAAFGTIIVFGLGFLIGSILKTTDYRLKTRDQRLKTKDRRPKTKDQRLKTEDQRPKTKDRRPKTKD